MTDPQQLRAIVAAWWEDTFVNDYVIDRSGNYRSAEDCIEDIVIRARAALAEAEEQAVPAPPADGEVAELPPRPPLITPPAHPALERYGITWDGSREKPVLTLLPDGYWTPWHVAAELLQRQALVPVPISERLPGPEDCDAEGSCWWWSNVDGSWYLRRPLHPAVVCPADLLQVWLPAHALPLPEVG